MNGDHPYKILVVDDDKFLLNMYSIKFQKEKFEVTTASDGADAVAKLQSGIEPDAIVLDIVMPVMDGLQFLEERRKEGLAPGVPVVMITTEGSEPLVLRAIAAGARGYICKPFTPDQVRARVLPLLNK